MGGLRVIVKVTNDLVDLIMQLERLDCYQLRWRNWQALRFQQATQEQFSIKLQNNRFLCNIFIHLFVWLILLLLRYPSISLLLPFPACILLSTVFPPSILMSHVLLSSPLSRTPFQFLALWPYLLPPRCTGLTAIKQDLAGCSSSYWQNILKRRKQEVNKLEVSQAILGWRETHRLNVLAALPKDLGQCSQLLKLQSQGI